MFLFSIILHGGIFLFFAFNPDTHQKKEAGETKPFSLVNIVLLEPEEPAPASLTVFQDIQTEEYIPLDEIPEILQEAAFVENDTGSSSVIPAENDSKSANMGAARDTSTQNTVNTAVRKAYLDRNLKDIQRRIRDRLIYPSQARRAGIRGTVELSFIMLINGSVRDVQVLTSSGQEMLDIAAIETIYAAAPFRPPPEEMKLIIPITYSLK
ncbi:energy transducer TonB [Leadbettera azotonutricia]|uniref:TonB family protein n=1 Tax=Leadbettera azotonutricia (strain ATCC BAA-888 / DSM 13862 / ZAS-9) TaxID=545695 RepID=F5YEP5_LEAAZ|nr:energy transducer TonB [Leadbettera azotonutricia]AEF82694.1 TonB family protein [Leadbettera azotonutricia ZAS-9]